MEATDLTLRPLLSSDRELMRAATLANMNWTGSRRFTYADIDSTPEFSHYFRFDEESGDFGLAAESNGRLVGLAWLTFFDATDPGFGYIADGVPELSISVWDGYRRRGAGRLLLRALLGEARNRRIERVSLSIEEGNGAVDLYRQCGFAPVEGNPYNAYIVDLESVA